MKRLFENIRVWWWGKSYKKIYRYGLMETGFSSTTHSDRQFELLVRDLKKHFGTDKERIILDIGGGDGALTSKIFGEFKTVFIMDYCGQAFSNYKASGYGNIIKIVGNMFYCPFKANSVDSIFTYSTFHSIGSEKIAKNMISDWYRLLKPGGVLYIGDIPDRAKLGYILKETVKFVQSDLRQVKSFFGIAMNSYFSKSNLARYLCDLGMDVEIVRQPEYLRFSRQRFDIKAVKR